MNEAGHIHSTVFYSTWLDGPSTKWFGMFDSTLFVQQADAEASPQREGG